MNCTRHLLADPLRPQIKATTVVGHRAEKKAHAQCADLAIRALECRAKPPTIISSARGQFCDALLIRFVRGVKVPTCSRHKCPTPHPPRLGGSTQDTASIAHRYASRSTHHADCDPTRAGCRTLAAMGDKGTERAPISRRQPFGCAPYLARIGKTTSREPSLGLNENTKITEKDWYLSFPTPTRGIMSDRGNGCDVSRTCVTWAA